MKLTIEIKKGYVYTILGLLILITGILIVNASNYVNPVTKVGHDASEVGPGLFPAAAGQSYDLNPDARLTFRGVTAAQNMEIRNIQGLGILQISNNAGGNMLFANTTDIIIPQGIYLNNQRISAWPQTVGVCNGTIAGWLGSPVQYHVSSNHSLGQNSDGGCTFNVYTWGTDPLAKAVNMGNHKFCALNQVQISDNDASWGNPQCRIWYNRPAGTWELISITDNIKKSIGCSAYCLD